MNCEPSIEDIVPTLKTVNSKFSTTFSFLPPSEPTFWEEKWFFPLCFKRQNLFGGVQFCAKAFFVWVKVFEYDHVKSKAIKMVMNCEWHAGKLLDRWIVVISCICIICQGDSSLYIKTWDWSIYSASEYKRFCQVFHCPEEFVDVIAAKNVVFSFFFAHCAICYEMFFCKNLYFLR